MGDNVGTESIKEWNDSVSVCFDNILSDIEKIDDYCKQIESNLRYGNIDAGWNEIETVWKVNQEKIKTTIESFETDVNNYVTSTVRSYESMMENKNQTINKLNDLDLMM